MKEFNDPTEYKFRIRDCFLGAQMLFVAFGALVLVPLLTGLNPSVALFTAGLGTLIFQMITRGKVPIFLASSFAFIAAIQYGVKTWGIPGTMCGLFAAGVFYMVLSVCIKMFGAGFLHRWLPKVVVGPVIMVIGLVLAPVAVFMAMGMTGDGSFQLVPKNTALIISLVTLVSTILFSILAKGVWKLIPILCGIVVGYVLSMIFGIVDFSGIAKAAWISIPAFTAPSWNFEAILFIVPVAIAPAIEHFGDVLAIGGVSGRDYVEDPGIHRTMMGDGVATSIAAIFGGPPNTTYSEVTGAVAITKAFNPAIMTWAAIIAIVLAFVGKLGAILQTVPVPVMGGIMILCFGAITVVGLKTLMSVGEEILEARNLSIIAVILVFGIGGMSFFGLSGIGLAGIVGIVMNWLLPGKKKYEAGHNVNECQ